MLYQWEVGRLSVPEVAESFWRIGEVDAGISDRARERAAELVSRHRRARGRSTASSKTPRATGASIGCP